MTIHDLRRLKYKVRVTTYRYCYSDYSLNDYQSLLVRMDSIRNSKTQDHIIEKGGKVVVEITSPKGDSAIGVAECSKKEQFNKKTGREIALGRALKKLDIL